MPPPPKLFISYRRTQFAHVKPIVDALQSAGIECFLDVNDIDPLADFPETIRTGIDCSHAFLVWWSKDYAESDHCLQEFRRAWQHARRISSDLSRRIWILNPESTADHIAAGELNAQIYLKPPAGGGENAWVSGLLERLRALLPEGPLADERSKQPVPTMFGIPTKSTEFTGRGRELMNIHTKLHPPRIGPTGAAVAVQTHGMAGIGKTELATAYARDFAMAYPGGIYWLNLAGWTPGNLAGKDEVGSVWLRALEQSFSLDTERARTFTRDPEGKALSPAAAHEKLAARLGSQPDYLWILDNFPEISPLDARARVLDFIRAPTASGRTLLTTRDGRAAHGFAQERLDVLSEEDAVRLLARFRPQQARAELDAMRGLAREVGAHTQAMILLGEHARNNPGGYPRALERLIETGKLARIEQIADQLRNLLGSKARGIIATFELSIEPLDTGAKELLSLASVCAPNLPIPDALLAAAFGGRDREDAFIMALNRILRASLLTRRESAVGTLFIHPLVAAAAIYLIKVDEITLRQQLADVLLQRIATVDDIRTHGLLADEVQQARELARKLEEQRGVRLLLRTGAYESARGHYANARIINAQSLALATRTLGEKHQDTLTAMSNLALTMRDQGDLGAARPLQEQTLSLRRRELGEEHHDTLTAMNNLALTMREQGEHGGARTLQEQTLSVRRRLLGEDDPATLNSMGNLALTLRAQGDLGAARALQEQEMLIRRRVQGAEHRDTLKAMSNFALTLSEQGNLNGARALHERVLPIYRRDLGEGHPDTLGSMNNLAVTLQAQGDIGGARVLQEQVLAISSRELGKEHQNTSKSAVNLLVSLRALKDFAAADALLRRELIWLINRDPATLTADQRKIRDYISRLPGM